MAIEIFMPALSPTMEEGTLATWLVKEGDTVSSGDVIAEIETDKATMEVESIDDGVMAKILIDAGTDNVPVGQIIAILAEEGEDIADISVPAPAPSPTPSKAPEPEAEAKGADAKAKVAQSDVPDNMMSLLTALKATGVEIDEAEVKARIAQSDTPSTMLSLLTALKATQTDIAEDEDRVKASPLAKRIAATESIDIASLSGSGPHGRIVKRDVEAAVANGTAAQTPETPAGAPATAPASQPTTQAPAASVYPPHDDIPFREERLSNMRKTIAKRLTESKTTVPHFYLTIECEIDKLLAQRKELNDKLADSGIKISVNDFIIRACGLALKKVPAANTQFAGDKMYWYERADISMAVAIDGGLVTPVIRGADQMGLADIATTAKELALKARDGKLMPEDYAGGTFSISNLGMFGIKEFSAVINPPQGAILAIGAGEQRPVVKDGALAVATVMSCTMSCDHRAVDGAVGAEFLKAFKGFIEDPITMLL